MAYFNYGLSTQKSGVSSLKSLVNIMNNSFSSGQSYSSRGLQAPVITNNVINYNASTVINNNTTTNYTTNTTNNTYNTSYAWGGWGWGGYYGYRGYWW
jgi:hypothetical protein